VTLPPFEDQVKLTVAADGYRKQRVIHKIQDGTELTILLEKEEKGPKVNIVLSDGSPATGAQVAVISSLGDSQPCWEGTTSSRGETFPPQRCARIIVAKHPAAAALIAEWQPDEVDELRMPDPTSTVIIRGVDNSGQPLRSGGVLLWIGDHKLGDYLHYFLFHHAEFITVGGTASVKGAPPQKLGVLVYSIINKDIMREAELGTYDHLRTSIHYPWPPEVIIEVLQ
jgi:hypothetical protein